jgi:hypothetical protein
MHNLMVAAQAMGAEFLFKAQVINFPKEGGRKAGVEELINIKTRPIRQQVAHVPASEGLNWEWGGQMPFDGDIGCYSQPEVGNRFLIGSQSTESGPRPWVDDPNNYDLNFTDQYRCIVLREAMCVSELPLPKQYQGLSTSVSAATTGFPSTTCVICRVSIWPSVPAAISIKTHPSLVP